jgi:hypothetical protein
MTRLSSVLSLLLLSSTTQAFAPSKPAFVVNRRQQNLAPLYATTANDRSLTRVPEDDVGVPIPFLDKTGNAFIECYADSIAILDGEEYTIGVPCDYSVALCYFEDGDLVPVELDDKLMDDIFPIAENIVAEEFGEELVLQRTPQTLTLVGELEEDEEDEDEEGASGEEGAEDGDEEVEVLLSFEHRGTEFNLVRLLDPILLVGKNDPERPDLRILLTPEESDEVMPVLEELFLEFGDEDREGMVQ